MPVATAEEANKNLKWTAALYTVRTKRLISQSIATMQLLIWNIAFFYYIDNYAIVNAVIW